MQVRPRGAMTVRVKTASNRASQRLVLPALAAILLSLAGYVIWTAVRSQNLSAYVVQSASLAGGYGHVRDGMVAQADAARTFADGHREGQVERFQEKGELVRTSIATVRDDGTEADRARAASLAATHDRFESALRRAMGDEDRRSAIGAIYAAIARATPAMDRVHDLAHASHEDHVDDMTAVSSHQRDLLVLTLIAVPLGVFLLFILAVAYRRTEREEAAALKRAALSDALTGLGNLRRFREDLRELLPADGPLALALVDLNGLKAINDREGHAAGDARLRELAAALASLEPTGARGYRVGGDEFALLSPRVEVGELLERLLTAIPAGCASAGVTSWEPGLDPDAFVHRADLALLEAKRTHRSVQPWAPDLEPRAIEMEDAGPHRQRDRAMAGALAHAVDARDPQTRSHCETVAGLAELVARQLGLDSERVARVRLAGLLHDVGKIGVPDSILLKPARLTADEYEVMKGHSVLGSEIVAAAGLAQEAEWVRHHHERVDGGGYPCGLAEDEIPLEARLLHVADAYEAMTAGRIYQPARSRADAIAELRANIGTQFDEQCVEALCAVVGEAARVRV